MVRIFTVLFLGDEYVRFCVLQKHKTLFEDVCRSTRRNGRRPFTNYFSIHGCTGPQTRRWR